MAFSQGIALSPVITPPIRDDRRSIGSSCRREFPIRSVATGTANPSGQFDGLGDANAIEADVLAKHLADRGNDGWIARGQQSHPCGHWKRRNDLGVIEKLGGESRYIGIGMIDQFQQRLRVNFRQRLRMQPLRSWMVQTRTGRHCARSKLSIRMGTADSAAQCRSNIGAA